jgi:hypothetical protein
MATQISEKATSSLKPVPSSIPSWRTTRSMIASLVMPRSMGSLSRAPACPIAKESSVPSGPC